MRIATIKEVINEVVGVVLATKPDRGLLDLCDDIGIEPSNFRSCLAGTRAFPNECFRNLMERLPDSVARETRERLEHQFRSAKAAYRAKLAVRRSRRPRQLQSGHDILLRRIRSQSPKLARESYVYEIMERSTCYQERHRGVLLSLSWRNLSDLLMALVDSSRRTEGEAAAFHNAVALFQAMRFLPVKNTAESLSALNLSYWVGDLAAQFDDWDAIEEIRNHLEQLLKEIKGRDADIFCRRMLDEYASTQNDRYGAKECLEFAHSAMKRFAATPKRSIYLSQDFWRLQGGWASTFFNYIQVAMPTARTDWRLQGLRAVYDRALKQLGAVGSMTDDAAMLTAPDPYRAQLITAQELTLARYGDRGARYKHIDRAIAMTTFALDRFGGAFREGQSIVAQLRVDHAAALLRTYSGERQWPLAASYEAVWHAAREACAEAGVVHKMSRLELIEKAVRLPAKHLVHR
jgi:hypothetical protein